MGGRCCDHSFLVDTLSFSFIPLPPPGSACLPSRDNLHHAQGQGCTAAANFSGSKQAVLETVVNKAVGGAEWCLPAELMALPWDFGLQGKQQKGILFVTSGSRWGPLSPKPFLKDMADLPLSLPLFGIQLSPVDSKHSHNPGKDLRVSYKNSSTWERSEMGWCFRCALKARPCRQHCCYH